ncbi:hypothetical protein AB4Y43_33635 [Paraburkholderia sp. BR10872]|uniref:hypothetical protein n=1 Tax=Paraburkholderia sp. BR10872 TaxID=3236989 RepID=UPI0034D24332
MASDLYARGGRSAAPLLPVHVEQRLGVREREVCPKMNIRHEPQPDVIFPVS